MRENAFKVLVGSHNYNLNTANSDKDYKMFFYPSFEDLYSGEKYSKATTGETEDVELHDIRKLPDMLWKSNVNFLEVLFSKEVEEYRAYFNLYKELHSKREEIASMNLPYLYDACMGMFHKKKKEFERDIEKSVDWSKVSKHTMSVTRIVDFLHRYEANNWSFENAIYYSENEHMRNTLLDIRNGKYETETELRVFIDGSERLLQAIKPVYKSKQTNEEVKEWMYKTVKWEVEEKIFTELQ
ncbi:DNA polymerase beta superfamily protein [Cytobacillus gottheilii]|uniref:DNA polymerase beta superfamily protein n=1 Tax=Cytobacillus gottheilii TaxID=859144 RepID=UPI0009BBF516|nr:nucleotidyltransferase domain-containing protein [Cytobacillus gottheilii]